MPKLADFIRSDKSRISIGEWKPGHVPRHAFPLSGAKSKGYKFGPEYSWRLIQFECLGRRCRILLIFNEGKQILRSTFGVEVGGDVAVLCTHEFHADHPGWHCHLHVCDLSSVPVGTFRSAQKRWPRARAEHSRKDFGVTKASALSHVAARFRFQAMGELI